MIRASDSRTPAEREQIFQPDPSFTGSKCLIFFGPTHEFTLVYERDDNTPRYPHYLDLPGGGFEIGRDNTPFDTLKRETREEFGLCLDAQHITYARAYPSKLKPGTRAWFMVAHLPTEMIPQITFGDEGVGYTIMPLGKFLNAENVVPAHRAWISDYLETLSHDY